jgi:hypothetical protein
MTFWTGCGRKQSSSALNLHSKISISWSDGGKPRNILVRITSLRAEIVLLYAKCYCVLNAGCMLGCRSGAFSKMRDGDEDSSHGLLGYDTL